MSLRRIKIRMGKFKFLRFRFANVVIAVVCIIAGYLISVVGETSREAFQEIRKIKSVLNDMGGIGDVKNIEELKAKIKDNPEMMKRISSSMIKKYESNPLLKKKIEEKMKEF